MNIKLVLTISFLSFGFFFVAPANASIKVYDHYGQELGDDTDYDQMMYLEYIKSSLHQLSFYMEAYASTHRGHYPETMNDLLKAPFTPVQNNFCNEDMSGYRISCLFTTEGYEIKARPLNDKKHLQSFIIATGGELSLLKQD